MKKLLSQIFSNRVKTFVLSLIAITGLATGTVFAGYGPNGPERPIYDFSNPAQREGSFDGPRFNSYINTNVYGDERAFLDAKECVAANDSCYTQGQAGGYADQQPVQAGKEYIIRAYVHNIAHPSTNGTNMDGIGVAKNTRIRFEMPEGMANGFTMQARISADNAKPQMVYDTVDLKNDTTPFDIDYVPGSARIYNSAHPTGLTLSDNIMGATGVQIGHDQMNGVYPGCFEYASFVVIRVKAKTNQVEFKKQVRKAGVQEWSKITNVKPGEKIQWVLTFQNKGQTTFDDVTLSDQLPPHVTLVPGSVRYIDAAQDVPQQDRPLFTTGGINFSTWKPNGGFHVRFDTVAKDDFAACEVTVRNLGFYKTKQTPSEKQDHADVKITKENCQPTKPPVTTVTTPPKPAELPKTGAGSVVGIFSAVSVAGAVAHRYFIGRRFN